METPVGWDEAILLFGDPSSYRLPDGTLSPAYERDHIDRVELPRPMRYVDGGTVTRIAVNKAILGITDATMRALAEVDEFWSILQPYGGGFEPRCKRGTSKPSLHTLGAALDFNPNQYPLGSEARFPDALVRVFIDHGWFYGGDFRGRKDPQHVQFCRRY